MRTMFVSDSITPVTSTADTTAMASGGPGLPSEFTWRSESLIIAKVLKNWRETGPCRNGSSESYVRKHWYDVETTTHQKARIYFDRQPRSRNPKKRWWLFSIETL